MFMAATATLVVGLSAGVTAASAADWLYYGNMGKVGRVQVDGTNRDDNFASGFQNTQGIAAAGSAVYVATKVSNNSDDKTLWKVDGSGTKTDLLGSLMCSTVAGTSPYGLATDGEYLYYICENGTGANATTRYLARVSLDGTSRNETFSGALTGIFTSSSSLTAGGGYAYFLGGPSPGVGGVTGVYRVALTAGALAAGQTGGVSLATMAWSPAGLFWINAGGFSKSLGRFPVADFPGWNSTSVYSSITSDARASLAADSTNVFWVTGSNPPTIAKGNADGSGTPDTSFLSFTGFAMPGYLAVGSGPGGDTPAPAPTPAPTPGATPAATVLKAPTQSTTADSNGNVAVTLSLQLDDVGKYTFIFEKVTSNEMSREQASGSSRISMQKGTKIGKRKLTKVVTAANVTTTSAGAKLVMRALLKKAQAKKWNLRVVHTAADGTLTQSVIKK
jgi:hypothetical protein